MRFDGFQISRFCSIVEVIKEHFNLKMCISTKFNKIDSMVSCAISKTHHFSVVRNQLRPNFYFWNKGIINK